MIYPPYKDIKQYLLNQLNENYLFNKNGTVNKEYKIYIAVTKDLGIIVGSGTTAKPNLFSPDLFRPDEIFCHFFNNKFEIMNLNEEQYYEICRTLEKYYKEYLVDEKLNDLNKDFE